MSSDAIIYYVSNKFLKKKKNLRHFGILTFSRVPAPS